MPHPQASGERSRPVVDLFSGAVGAWSLGMHRAGYQTVAACEADPWRRAVYSVNNPGVRLYDDVRTLTADRIVSDCGHLPFAIVGSPPCQDVSAANTKGKGIDGERTGLFFEAIRLVGECRPRWCAFENSPHLRTRGYDRIADALEALGYACWPPVVGADDLGAPHIRKRVWIVAFDAAGIERERLWRPYWQSRAEARPRYGLAEDAADALRDGIRLEPGRGERQDWPGAAVAPHDTNADRNSGGLCPSGSEPDGRGAAGQCAAEDRGDTSGERCGQTRAGAEEQRHGADSGGDAGNPDSAGLAEWESLGDDARAQLAALERAVGSAVRTWNGGAARHIRMAHGIAGRLAGIRVADFKHPGATINAAKACISAQGDAILPQIAEAIGRAILRVETALAAVSEAA